VDVIGHDHNRMKTNPLAMLAQAVFKHKIARGRR